MTVDVRKGQGNVKLSRDAFERRLRERFVDAARTLVGAVKRARAGQRPRTDRNMHPSRPK